MDRVLAIDPGVHACAWAFRIGSKTTDVGIGKDKPPGQFVASVNHLIYAFHYIGQIAKPEIVIVEHPVIYPVERAKADPNDIVKLAAVAGVVGAACAAASIGCELEFVMPRQWKGTVPKHIHNERTRARCPEAVALVDCVPKSQQHNIWDAVALALWRSERTA